MTATLNMLDRNGVIAYVGQNAAKYRLDPAAVLAVANHEGLNTNPGSSWVVPGEPKISFGPPSWYAGGAGSGFLSKFGNVAAAWTPEGIDYWLQQIAAQAPSAIGQTGYGAISAIVNGFERPRADLAPGEITNAAADYAKMQAAIGIAPNPVPLPSPGPDQQPGQVQTPGTTTTTAAPPTGGVNAGQIGPFPINIPSGLVLALIGALLLIVGAMLFAFNVQNRVVTTASDFASERM